MPYLSIIVPIYNKAGYLDECVNSILAQTFKDFELILVNDGSRDNSGEICEKFKLADDRVTVIHQTNQGVSAARNAGLDCSTGKYIGFVDADDILDADMYESLLKNADDHKADISICGVKRVSPKKIHYTGNDGTTRFFNTEEGVIAQFRGEILMSNYEKIFLRETVKDIRFQPALFEDTYYNFEALKAAKKTVYEKTVRYNYMIRDNSHSLAPFNQKYMNMLILTKRMITDCERDAPHLKEEAEGFDFNTNIMVLNMILTESKSAHEIDYQIIMNNLKRYGNRVMSITGIKMKYRWMYYILLLSPVMYTQLLKLYCILTGSEYLDRKPAAKTLVPKTTV